MCVVYRDVNVAAIAAVEELVNALKEANDKEFGTTR